MEQPPQMVAGTAGMVRRRSGLIIPAAVQAAALNDGTAYDPDGRRRIVMTHDERKLITRAVNMLTGYGVAAILACRVDAKRDDGRKPCGKPMTFEGADEGDPGMGCECTRVHFR